MSNFITKLIEEYIAYRNALGFDLKNNQKELRKFGKYIESNYPNSTNLTADMVLTWVSRDKKSQKTMGRRLEVIRPFMKYANAIDDSNQVILSQPFSNVRMRPIPHIYSENEVLSMMDKCDELNSSDGIRAKSMRLIIGLLWATGMRPGEITNLSYGDYDSNNGTLFIKDTKFHKSRLIPLHRSVSTQINDYIQWLSVNGVFPTSDEPLLYTTGKKKMTHEKMFYAFKLIRKDIDTGASDYNHVRLYDFRHTFASRTIEYLNKSNSKNASERIYLLSVYLGHEHPEDTFWYLTSTTSILDLVKNRYETFMEVQDEE